MAMRADAIDLSRENWKVPSWDPRLTQAGAVKEFVGKTCCGHVQGMDVVPDGQVAGVPALVRRRV